MKVFALTFVFLCVSAHGVEVTPVQKVIQLMEGMLEKGKKEKHDEQVQFAAYKQFCDDTTVEKNRAIDDANESIDTLKADIGKCSADAKRLTGEIAEIDEDVSIWKGDIKAATAVRKIEKTDYDTTHQDYSESIDALNRAIVVLKKQSSDRQQTALLQVKELSLIPAEAKKTLDLFLTQSDADEVDSPPEANAYEFQSSGVVNMLSKLLDKFVSERTALEKQEMNSKHAYDMLMQDLEAQITQGTNDRTEKAETKAARLEARADATDNLNDTTTTRNADAKYLRDLTATCEQKASDFESRQQLRADEIVAIEKAIEIISGNAVSGNANKHLPGLLQTSSFAQLRADLATQAQARVSNYLQSRAKELNSRVLSTLAARVSADPFTKVKKMIKELIVRLMEEANEEAEHKGWCDTEMSTNQQTRTEKTNAVEVLHAEIDELEASIAKLTEDISALAKQVADLDAAMAEATENRQTEHAKNTETIQDSQEAQTAVAQALTVLKEFYAKAAEATALVQKKAEPEIFDTEYKGMGAESGGVVGMLEVIESDFARLESDTKAAEATALKEYDSLMSDSREDKAQKQTTSEHKQAKKQDESQALNQKNKDLEGTQKELDTALAYYEKLKPTCVDADVSYEERVARRKAEIESLQDALKILNGEEVP